MRVISESVDSSVVWDGFLFSEFMSYGGVDGTDIRLSAAWVGLKILFGGVNERLS